MRLASIFIALGLGATLTSGLVHAGSVSVQVLDKDGKPAPDAVVVLVTSAKGGAPKTPMPMTATVVQEKMQFVPSVSVVPLGARVKFVNNDPWDHHVRASAAGAAQFTSGTPPAFDMRLEGKSDGKPAKFAEVTLDKPGALGASLLGCFLHGSMRGNLYVSDSPWAAKTGADGMATFDDVPDGAAQVKVWQADQLIDLPPQQVTVGTTPLKLKAQLQVVPRRPRVTPTTSYSG
jgi:plastocyanin